ncbi:MAG: heme-binding protein [Pyrinomonadaceae bacterium]
MITNSFTRRRYSVSVCAGLILSVVAVFFFGRNSSAQATHPILISEATSTRAVAVDSVTRLHEPFSLVSRAAFVSDRRTRIQLFALNIDPFEVPSALTVEAEDGAGRIYSLPVEHLGRVPGQQWMHSLTVRLHDEMANVGDVLVGLRYKGTTSNRVRLGIGHVGGGKPDDVGSIPTPAPAATTPTPNTNPLTAGNLTPDDVRTVIAQAVSAAVALNRRVTVAVTDREGNVLGIFHMPGAPARLKFVGGTGFNQTPNPITGLVPNGLDGADLPPLLNPVRRAAISKAGTSAFFSTFGNAFTPRTASFIIQEHFPPGVDNQAGGPLFGVQFSSLECSDVKMPGLPFGLSGDPGAMPIYKNGVPSGGVGIEGDGIYTIDRDVRDFDKPFEEIIAVAAVRGYDTPPLIRGDNILVNGIRLPFHNITDADLPSVQTIPFANLPGALDPEFPVRGARPSAFVPMALGSVRGAVDLRFFPFRNSLNGSANALTAADVTRILTQGAQQADRTRAGIRQPLGSPAAVSVSVVDTQGQVLGIFRTNDAPVFGFDVAVQKARSAVFFSRTDAGQQLRQAGFGNYVDRAFADNVILDGSWAFSDRAIGFLHRPFFPDGINNTPAGPFSTPIGEWSPFNVGLQLDIAIDNLVQTLAAPRFFPANVPCTDFPVLANGLQIFAGSVPLYKNGELVGAIGISGDGIDQDDIIAAAGSAGFTSPAGIRTDQFFVRETRLPFVKFPRSPNL